MDESNSSLLKIKYMRNILNVAYSFDDGYAQHGGLSILSLLENNKDIDEINVYVIENNLSELNKTRINSIIAKFNRSIHYFELNKITQQLKLKTKFNRSSYGRIFLAEFVNVPLLMYVDSDTIINGSLKKLIQIDFSDCLIAGVQDTVNPYYIKGIELEYSHRYFNAGGIVVFNLDLWRKQNVIQKCVDFIYRFNGNPPHNDQGTLNNVCKDSIKILPLEYNVMPPVFQFTAKQIKSLFKMKTYYSQAEINEAVKHPIVIHYTDEFFNRPWFKNCTHPLKSRYLEYLERSPWADSRLKVRPLTKNMIIQNWVYKHCPFFIYKFMIRCIEFKHFIK